MSSDRDKLLSASPVQPGTVIAGKYRIESLLAAGGMGVVARARHVELNHEVAIKLVLRGTGDEDRVARFLREAQAAAQIQSEHVVRVFDCGRLDDGTPYMVMESLRGSDLRQLLKSRGTLKLTDAVDLMIDAMQGVADAHALGIVHRDLKPGNLFCVERRGHTTVKVLDFGISKAFREGEVDDELTHSAAVLGSPRYMSPEQARSSKHVDARTDIWSLGVILYELLDGASPFAGGSIGEVISKILELDPVPLHVLRPDVPEGLWRVVRRCLERDRERRYSSVAELARELAAYGSPRAQLAAAQVPEVTLTPAIEPAARGQSIDFAVDAGTRSSWEHATPVRGRRRGIALLLLGTLLGGALTAAIVWLRTKPTSEVASFAEPPPSVAASASAPVVAPLPALVASESARSQPDAAAPAAAKPRRAGAAPAPKKPKRDILGTSD